MMLLKESIEMTEIVTLVVKKLEPIE